MSWKRPSPITFLTVCFLIHSRIFFKDVLLPPVGQRERDAVLLFSASQMLRVRVDRAGNKLSTAFTCPLIDLSISFSLCSFHIAMLSHSPFGSPPSVSLHHLLLSPSLFSSYEKWDIHFMPTNDTQLWLRKQQWEWSTCFYNTGLCHIVINNIWMYKTKLKIPLKFINPHVVPNMWLTYFHTLKMNFRSW